MVEGVIGVGKTTLTQYLAADFGAKPFFELVEENPFLVKGFYKNVQDFGFNTEVFFLLSRFRQQRSLAADIEQGEFVISDYLFEKNSIFASLSLGGEDRELFHLLYNALSQNILRPDLVVYLTADISTIMQRIRFRDRPFERSLKSNYIERLSIAYEEFFATYERAQVERIDVTHLDFVARDKNYRVIRKQIEQRIGM